MRGDEVDPFEPGGRALGPCGCSHMNPAFERYIGIDYSGADTPKSSLKALRVCISDDATCPQPGEPNEDRIRKLEGWILGQTVTNDADGLGTN